jgi:glycosidase
MPSVFYGDEAGLEGFGDPFCRATFPWGRENKTLTQHYTVLCKIKKEYSALHDGELNFIKADGKFCAYERKNSDSAVLVLANAGNQAQSFSACSKQYKNLMTGEKYKGEIKVPAESAIILG